MGYWYTRYVSFLAAQLGKPLNVVGTQMERLSSEMLDIEKGGTVSYRVDVSIVLALYKKLF